MWLLFWLFLLFQESRFPIQPCKCNIFLTPGNHIDNVPVQCDVMTHFTCSMDIHGWTPFSLVSSKKCWNNNVMLFYIFSISLNVFILYFGFTYKLNVADDQFFENIMHYQKWGAMDNLLRLRQTVDKDE